ADVVNDLNFDIVEAMSLVKELTLMPGGTLAPPDELEPVVDDLLQAAAIRMTAPTPTATRVDRCLLDCMASPFLLRSGAISIQPKRLSNRGSSRDRRAAGRQVGISSTRHALGT